MPAPRRILVATDMHFGTPESSVNQGPVLDALVRHLVDQAPWEEIVLAGDLLDMNLSTLTLSLEGGEWPGTKQEIRGFRSFLERLHAAAAARGGLPGIAGRWTIVPGNHDYRLWDLLSTAVVCTDVLAASQPMGTVPTPMMRGAWPGAASFLAGVFRKAGAYDVRDRVLVEYPDRELRFGGELMVVTHGHYLDASQTRGTQLAEVLPTTLSDREKAKKILKELFRETAQYQAVAGAVSYTRDVRGFVSSLFGPAGIMSKLAKIVDAVGGLLARLFYGGLGSRGAGLSGKWLDNIDAYLAHLGPDSSPSRKATWFVFGHTHKQGEAQTPEKVRVFNAGSCYPDGGKAITFIQIEEPVPGQPAIALRSVQRSGSGWAVV